MWTCLLLLCVEFIIGMTTGAQCPTNCNCTLYAATVLVVDCQGRPDIDPDQLSNQLDSLLSSNLTYGRLLWLEISNSSLTHVPRSVCRLTTLRALSLTNNRLSRLPDNCLTNLTELTYLRATDNAIVRLQDGVFDGLTNLRHLYLSRNRISSVGSVCRLTTLKELYIDHNRLTGLPDNCFTNLSNLINLAASDNAIVTLQDGVFDGLRNLSRLYLSRNMISSIGSVCRLTTLTYLLVDHNRLTGLPNCLTNLSNLVWLKASDNAIVTLQDGVFDGLTNLFNLNLSRNRIEILQDGVFDGLRNLYALDLNKNKISSIGMSVFATSSNLSNVFFMSLSENNLTSLESWLFDRGLIGNFEHLVIINMSHNKISKFTNQMGHSSSKRYRGIPFAFVDLSYNSVQYIKDILNGWQLVLEGLNCYLIDSCFSNLQLVISHNNIACDCINYNFYRAHPFRNLRADCNVTDPITKKSRIMDAKNVDPSLFVCELTERCPAGCICFRRPKNATLHVYCSNKNLTVLPDDLPELPDKHTYKLDFSNNRLLRRLERRDYFVNTSILDVSDSSVDDVSDWEEIAEIPDVSLFGNKITSLPRSFLSINVTTRKLNLASNPWDCSCDNKWMSDCFSSIEDRLTQQVQCYSPPRLSGTNIIQISDEEFCVDPASEAASKAVTRTLTISMSSVVSVIVFLLFVGVMLHRLRVKLYTRWKFHPFDRDECLGEDMEYDVFFCCSSMDHDPHALRIVQLVESKGYRVCYHERDFLPGQLITENICRAIERSKRTICLLSENFLGR